VPHRRWCHPQVSVNLHATDDGGFARRTVPDDRGQRGSHSQHPHLSGQPPRHFHHQRGRGAFYASDWVRRLW